jgi:hypothetical protein
MRHAATGSSKVTDLHNTCMRLLAIVTFVTALVTGASAQQNSSATVEGRVLARDSNTPIAGANIELRPATASSSDPRLPGIMTFNPADLVATGGVPVIGTSATSGGTALLAATSRIATSGSDGAFALHDVPPGQYRLYATRANGFVPGEYGQQSATGSGSVLTVSAGQRVAGITLTMTPTGSITGRVVDRDGEPSGYAHVQALKAVYTNGRRTLTVAQLVQADERGMYRLFWLPPGDYYVCARPLDLRRSSEMMHIPPPSRFGSYEQQKRPTVTVNSSSRLLDSGEVVEAQHVAVFFSATRDERRATPIAIRAGQAVQGIDIDLSDSLVPSRRVRGRVLDGMTGQPTSASIEIVPRDAAAILVIPSTSADADGVFDLAGAISGPNYLVVEARGEGSALVPIDVPDADLNGITLTVWPPVTIPGQIRSDAPNPDGTDPNVAGLSVNLRRHPAVNGLRDPSVRLIVEIDPQTGQPRSSFPTSNVSSRDGVFALNGVPPGDYVITVPTRGDSYVESIQLGTRDVLRTGLHLEGSPPTARLDVVIGTRGGAVTGTVTNDRRQPAFNAVVVAVPETDRERLDLFKSGRTDASGHFELHGLAPGDYEILSWEAIEPGAWLNPEVLRADEGRGRRLHVAEGSKSVADLRSIPPR